ncbi:hypothetical protein N9Y89_00570 [bacterium]|nr:hypothetical protein [bacterium]
MYLAFFTSGQMDGKDLEKMMVSFMENEFDVLVSTTIIESGLEFISRNDTVKKHIKRLLSHGQMLLMSISYQLIHLDKDTFVNIGDTIKPEHFYKTR